MKIKYIINLHSEGGPGMAFTACYSELMQEEALSSFTVGNTYRCFAGQADVTN